MMDSSLITKCCSKCNEIKPIESFRKVKQWILGICRDCRIKEKKEWDLKNRKHVQDYQKVYIDIHAKGISENRKKYNERTKEHKRKYEMQRYYGNEQFRIAHNLRISIRVIITKGNGQVQNRRKIKLIGCYRYQFIEHLEQLFKDGMSWENYGTVWELDHIIPLSAFDLKNKEEVSRACFYKNIQPLFTIENKIKGNKILNNECIVPTWH